MALLDVLFPKECLECSSRGRYICNFCIKKVSNGKIDFIEKNFSAYKYEGVIRRAIIKIKYNFASDIANELIDNVYNNFKLPIKINDPVLVPVPLYRDREKWRGYNQSLLLGKLFAEKMGWSVEENLLIRKESTLSQARLSREDRLRNMRDKFAVNTDKIKDYIQKDIILFDDVITTGTTISECKRILRKNGINNIVAVSICS